MKFAQRDLEEMIEEADINGDGKVDQSEFIRIMLQTNLFWIGKVNQSESILWFKRVFFTILFDDDHELLGVIFKYWNKQSVDMFCTLSLLGMSW